jgi:tetratricopeptide (TPR) repeat protein
MPPALQHPARELLASYGLGRLAEPDANSVYTHLESCDACRALVEGLPDDGLALLVRMAADLPLPAASLESTATEAEGVPVATLILPPGRAGRCELRGEVGRGGMGDVLAGLDPVLNRPLAVKVLRPDRHGDPECERRFVEEAQICGQLQHPGVPPVYDIGRLDDDRPYFTMKLVRGRTLADLLAGRETPSDDLPRFTAVFEQVCQTLGYAHSRGVVHRDLKPANVMVGEFGEVQVMDWGLAKVLASRAPQPQTGPPAEDSPGVVCTVRSESADRSQVGTVLGTPAYMAPEQARAEAERVDVRADVFGLGAVLCEVLTGAPPYRAGDRVAVLTQAASADLADAFARLDGCGEADLVKLARACLDPDPARRPADAGAVAAAVTAHRRSVEERLRAAELARVEDQAKALRERQRRRWALALAALLLLTLAAATGGGWWAQRQRAESERLRDDADRKERERRQAVEEDLGKVAQLEGQARWAEARAVLGAAETRLGEADARDLRQRLEQARKELDLADRLDAVRLQKATIVENKIDYAGADRAYAAAFREVGLGDEGSPEEVAARIRASGVCSALVAVMDDWAAATGDESRRGWLLEVTRRADPDPGGWRDRFRDPAAWRSREALAKLADEARAQLAAGPADQLSPQLLDALAKRLRVMGGNPVPMLLAAQARHPGDFWLNFALGNALAPSRPGEAIGYYRAALAGRPDASAVHNNLGAALYKESRIDEALEAFREAVACNPEGAKAHYNFGIALQAKGRLDDADDAYRRAAELDPKFAAAHNAVGASLYRKSRLDEAIEEFVRAVKLDSKLARAHSNLGNALRDKGRLDDAIAAYRRAVELEPQLAVAHHNLGAALLAKDRPDEAIEEFRAAVAFDKKLASAHSSLGVVLQAKGRLDEALNECRRAVELDPKDAKAHQNLGNALLAKGRWDESIDESRRAVEFDSKLALAHSNLGVALLAKGRLDEALDESGLAVEIAPTVAMFRYNLGNSLLAKGRLEDAVVEYGKAIDLKRDYAEAHCNLGRALQRQGGFAEALVALKRGHELGAARADWHYPSAQWVRQCQRLVELDALLPAVLNGSAAPADADVALGLVCVCRFTERFAAAARLSAEVFAADPARADDRRTGARYDAARCAALGGCGRGDGAPPGDAERARLRAQAHAWLRADLSGWAKAAGAADPSAAADVRAVLRSWREDAALAGIRDADSLAMLPEPERAAWRQLWADVDALLEKTPPK